MSRSQVFTKIFHFCKNSRHHALKANLNWLTKTSVVCYCLLNINISSISGRFPPSSITFGLINYFNWFNLAGGGGGRKSLSYAVIRYDYYTTLLIMTIALARRRWLNAGSFITGVRNIWVRKEIWRWMLVCSKGEKSSWLEEKDILATSWGMSWMKLWTSKWSVYR